MKIEKKIGINSLSGEKKLGKNTGREKESRRKISSGKNFVTCKKFRHFSPTFFSPIRYLIPKSYHLDFKERRNSDLCVCTGIRAWSTKKFFLIEQIDVSC